MPNKTARAWRALSESLRLTERLEAGSPVLIAASEIHRVAGREPRLMMKFDTRSQRPLGLENATVLPVANGEYVILPGDGYHDLEAAEKRTFRLPDTALNLKTLPWDSGPSSESQMLDMALASGILQDFLKEDSLQLTIRGRLRSPRFTLDFNTGFGIEKVTVDGIQVEVDAGLEGDSINLIEAKMGKRTDFHIRQLYFPLRMWTERVPEKLSRAIFVSYSDLVYSMRLYEFSPLEYFHGIRLVRAVDYVQASPEELEPIADLLHITSPIDPTPGITFPQANDIEKVIDLIDAVGGGTTDYDDISDHYGFDVRQARYYADAARYLGFLQPTPELAVTELGLRFASSSRITRHNMLRLRLTQLPIFRATIIETLVLGAIPPVRWLIDVMAPRARSSSGKPFSDSTLRRRAQTVVSWIRWALQDEAN